MPTLAEREHEEFRQMYYGKNNGRIITPEGIRFICEAHNYDPEVIGKYNLEILSRIQNK